MSVRGRGGNRGINIKFGEKRDYFDDLATEHPSTPWHMLKEDALRAGEVRNVEELADEEFENNLDRQEMMKERAEGYRKFVIEEGKKVVTNWETFSDKEEEDEKPKLEEPNEISEIYNQESDDQIMDSAEEEEEEEPMPIAKSNSKPEKKLKKSKNNPNNKKKSVLLENKAEETSKVKSGKRAREVDEDTTLTEEIKSRKTKKGKKKAKMDANQMEASLTDKEQKGVEETPVQPKKLVPLGSKSSKPCCLGCRKEGHALKNCPKFKGANVCIKCGSAEHKYQHCPTVKNTSFEFATCFICNQTGHISRQCEQNTKGVYPNGGSCLHCLGINHLAKDCPKMRKRGRGRGRGKPGFGNQRKGAETSAEGGASSDKSLATQNSDAGLPERDGEKSIRGNWKSGRGNGQFSRGRLSSRSRGSFSRGRGTSGRGRGRGQTGRRGRGSFGRGREGGSSRGRGRGNVKSGRPFNKNRTQ